VAKGARMGFTLLQKGHEGEHWHDLEPIDLKTERRVVSSNSKVITRASIGTDFSPRGYELDPFIAMQWRAVLAWLYPLGAKSVTIG